MKNQHFGAMICRRWFHPHLSGQEAQDLLLKKGFHGSYLVRPSKNTAGDYTLSVRQRDKVVHIKISNTGDCYHLYDYESFATLSELIQVYTQEKGKLTTADGEVTELIHPLYSNDPTNERWYHGRIDGKAAEKLLLTKGDRNTFLVRESISKPGSFVISVKTSEDDVAHIMINSNNKKYSIPGRGNPPEFSTLTELVDYYKRNHLVDCSRRPYYLLETINATLINLSTIKERMEVLEKPTASGKTGFLEEFEQLQCQEDSYERTEGMKPENKPKNRYKNILPFDHSRVILKNGDPNVPGTDYINANYITLELFGGERTVYIATQGCLQNTVADFWRMIWEDNVGIIVCLTRLQENGKNKCTQYWPRKDDKGPKRIYLHNHQLVIHCTETMPTDDYEIHDMEIKEIVLKDDEEVVVGSRPVYSFNFLTWPDKSVPKDAGPLLDFIQKIHDKQKRLLSCGPVVIHCSAGIGRTGAFMTMDYLLTVIKANGLECDVDIQKTVKTVRSMRSGMVQTETQYKFIYQAIRHYVETATSRINIQSHTSDQETYGNLYGTMPWIQQRQQHDDDTLERPSYENFQKSERE